MITDIKAGDVVVYRLSKFSAPQFGEAQYKTNTGLWVVKKAGSTYNFRIPIDGSVRKADDKDLERMNEQLERKYMVNGQEEDLFSRNNFYDPDAVARKARPSTSYGGFSGHGYDYDGYGYGYGYGGSHKAYVPKPKKKGGGFGQDAADAVEEMMKEEED